MAGVDLRETTRRARELGARLTPLQKVVLGAAALTLIAGGLVLTRSGSATQMSALYTDLDPRDAATIVDELSSRGVEYELAGAGRTILVPKDAVYDLRIALSAEGLPSSNEGYALLDQQGITTSEFRQHIDYQRALEGELANTLEAMDGIDGATVHLALPEESVFVDEPGTPTASVLVSTRTASGIASDQVQAIVHLVASSVKDMKPESVTVVDSSGAVLSAEGATGTGGGDARVKAESTFEQTLAASLTALVGRATGPGSVSVSVRADLDLDERQATSETFETPDGAAPGAVVSESTSSEVYSGGTGNGADAATGVLGPDGAQVAPAAADGANSYEKQDADRTYALDRVVEQTTTAPGALRRLNVAVLLDETVVDTSQAKAIEEMVSTAAGIDPERGDELVVTRLPFDTSAVTEATETAAAEEAAIKRSEQMELIRTAVIALVVVLALFLAYRSTRRARRVVATPIDIGEITAGGPLTAALPGPSSRHRSGPAGTDAAALPVAVDDAVSLAMRDITSMADRKPQEVASVLRSWLTEPKGRR